MAAPAQRPLRMGEVLDRSFALYRAEHATFRRILAMGILPATALNFLAARLHALPALSGVELGIPSLATPLPILLVQGLSAYIAFLMTAALALMTMGSMGERPPSAWEAWRGALGRWRPLLAVGALEFVGMSIGFALLWIPGLVLLVYVSFTVQAVVLEGLSTVAAWSESFALLRTAFGRVTGVVAIAFGLVLGLTLVANVPVELLTRSIHGVALVGLSALVTFVVDVLIGGFPAVCATVLYLDLRARAAAADAL